MAYDFELEFGRMFVGLILLMIVSWVLFGLLLRTAYFEVEDLRAENEELRSRLTSVQEMQIEKWKEQHKFSEGRL